MTPDIQSILNSLVADLPAGTAATLVITKGGTQTQYIASKPLPQAPAPEAKKG